MMLEFWQCQQDKQASNHITALVEQGASMKKICVTILAAALLVGCLAGYPGKAMAEGAVWGDCGSTNVAGHAEMLAGFTRVNTNIVSMQNVIAAVINGQTQAQKQLWDNFFKSQVQADNQRALAKAEADSKRLMLSRTLDDCNDVNLASAGSSGQKAAEKMRCELNKGQASMGEGTAKNEEEARSKVHGIVRTKFEKRIPDGNDLFPENGYFENKSGENGEVVVNELVMLLSDKRPNPVVGDLDSRAGMDALTEQRTKQTRLGLIRDALNESVIALQAPTTPAADFRTLLKETATLSDQEISEILGNGEMTSLYAILNAMAVKTRLMSSTWRDSIKDTPGEIHLLKELVNMQAIELAIRMQELRMNQRITALLAAQFALDLERSNIGVRGGLYHPGTSPVSAEGAPAN